VYRLIYAQWSTSTPNSRKSRIDRGKKGTKGGGGRDIGMITHSISFEALPLRGREGRGEERGGRGEKSHGGRGAFLSLAGVGENRGGKVGKREKKREKEKTLPFLSSTILLPSFLMGIGRGRVKGKGRKNRSILSPTLFFLSSLRGEKKKGSKGEGERGEVWVDFSHFLTSREKEGEGGERQRKKGGGGKDLRVRLFL